MNKKTSNIILMGMVLGAVLGVVGGYYFGEYIIHIKFLGTIFLNALKMIVVPLIIASMIVGVTSLGDIRKLGRTAGKTLTFYLATTGFSVLVGIILVNIIRPGVGVPLIGEGIPEFVGDGGQKTIIDIIVGLVPDNIFGAAASGQILPLIVFSLIFGGVLTAIGKKGKPVINFFEGINLAIMKIVMLIIYFAPVGIFALIGGIVAQNQESVDKLISALGLYAVTVIIGLLIHATITLPMILKFFGRKKPLEYVMNMGQALATAFTTASSSATLPVTMDCVEEKNKVDKKATSFVLPLGATINMDGTALYEAVAALFIAQIYGIDLSIGAQMVIFFTATLASIGAAAIPEAGLVMMTLVLTAVGLPLEGIGIILAIDWFLDRCRTTVNVWGDSVGAAVIGETKEIKRYLPPSGLKRTRAKKATPSRTEQTDRKKYAKTSQQSPYQRKSSRDDRQRGRKGDKDRGRYNGKHRKDKPVQYAKSKSPVKKQKKVSASKNDKIPKNTVSRELDKVRKQLDDMSHRTKDTVEKMKKEPPQKSDDFFNAEFSKMNLFEDDKKESSKSIVADEKPKDTMSALSVTADEKKPGDAETSSKAKPKKEDKEESEEPETNGGDFWGRSRKKRPSK
jgi:Na+/H+-dicarboxylate symporter